MWHVPGDSAVLGTGRACWRLSSVPQDEDGAESQGGQHSKGVKGSSLSAPSYCRWTKRDQRLNGFLLKDHTDKWVCACPIQICRLNRSSLPACSKLAVCTVQTQQLLFRTLFDSSPYRQLKDDWLYQLGQVKLELYRWFISNHFCSVSLIRMAQLIPSGIQLFCCHSPSLADPYLWPKNPRKLILGI